MSQIGFFVPGTPRPDGVEQEAAWRVSVFRATREKAQQIGWVCIPDGTQGHFEVEVVFLMQGTFGEADLDNLAPPVLNTLFRCHNPGHPANPHEGALTDRDDKWVWDLKLNKICLGAAGYHCRCGNTIAGEGACIGVTFVP